MTQTKKTNRKGTGQLAAVDDLVKYFRINRAEIPGLMTRMGVPKRGCGFPWQRIWLALGVSLSSVTDRSALRKPMLKLEEVAALLGESTKTTRRKGDSLHRDQSIPKHIDLGPRKRVYFAAEIQSWISGEPVGFERSQENLSFVARKPKGRKPKVLPQVALEERKPQIGPETVASLFMGPPPKP